MAVSVSLHVLFLELGHRWIFANIWFLGFCFYNSHIPMCFGKCLLFICSISQKSTRLYISLTLFFHMFVTVSFTKKNCLALSLSMWGRESHEEFCSSSLQIGQLSKIYSTKIISLFSLSISTAKQWKVWYSIRQRI